MSAVVRRALPLLKVLADAKPKLKKAIIQHAPTDLVTAISEIVLNLIKGVIKLTYNVCHGIRKISLLWQKRRYR